ncbi:MAG: hypothetical protein PHH04_00905 [Thomasclavelia sp.]|jgi:hypothetical protein|nr:hypothetical protein [Thomasclavelia sp.]
MKKISITLTLVLLLVVTGCSSSSTKEVKTDNNFYKTAKTVSTKVKDYVTNQDKANQDAANAVIALINGVGNVTVDSANTISNARAAYDKLTDAQKALVTNINTLTTAEATLKTKQEEAAKAKADQQTASNNTTTNNNQSSNSNTSSKIECTAANASKYKGKSINAFMSACGVHVSGHEDCLSASDGLSYTFPAGFTVDTNSSGIIVAVG